MELETMHKIRFYITEKYKALIALLNVEAEKINHISVRLEYCRKYLGELPDGPRDRAISQIHEFIVERCSIPKSKDEAVRTFRQWDRTKEGFDYWFLVRHEEYARAEDHLEGNVAKKSSDKVNACKIFMQRLPLDISKKMLRQLDYNHIDSMYISEDVFDALNVFCDLKLSKEGEVYWKGVIEKMYMNSNESYDYLRSSCKKYLQNLPVDIRDRALSQMSTGYREVTLPAYDTQTAVSRFCPWEKTKEGFDYWQCVYECKYDEARRLLTKEGIVK